MARIGEQIAVRKTRWRLAIALVVALLVVVAAEAFLLSDVFCHCSDARSLLTSRWRALRPWREKSVATLSGEPLPGDRALFLDDDVRRMHRHIDKMFDDAMRRMEQQMQGAMSAPPAFPPDMPWPSGPAEHVRYLQRDIDRLFRDALHEQARLALEQGFRSPFGRAWRTGGINLRDAGDHYLVLVGLPGVTASNLQVCVEGRMLLISMASDSGAPDVRRSETRLMMPGPVEAEAVKAELVGGVLQVQIPKAPRPTPQKIAVRPSPDA